MINDRLKNKYNDIQGLKKQSSALLNCAWEKGYTAGFNDGYATRREADKRPQGEWVRKVDVIQSIAKQYSEHDELVPMWLSIGDMQGGE